MQVIADQTFDLSYSDQKVLARIYEPALEPDGETLSCPIEIDAPVSYPPAAHGVSSLQALTLAVSLVSIVLYSSSGYEDKKLGWKGEFGGDLGLPAVHGYLDFAPYPF